MGSKDGANRAGISVQTSMGVVAVTTGGNGGELDSPLRVASGHTSAEVVAGPSSRNATAKQSKWSVSKGTAVESDSDLGSVSSGMTIHTAEEQKLLTSRKAKLPGTVSEGRNGLKKKLSKEEQKAQKKFLTPMEGRILQINLHHSKTATAELFITLEKGGYDVALIQEPWITSGNKVAGLQSNKNYKVYYTTTVRKTRSAILVKKSVNAYLLSNCSTDDLTVIAIEGEDKEPKLFASCYMAHDVDAPPPELQKLIEEAKRRGQEMVVGADANSHHPQWGSTDMNERGESLFNYILLHNVNIGNRGNIPTYVGPTSEEVLDITLCYGNNLQINEWKVLKQPSFSDHRYISFTVSFKLPHTNEVFRNPKNTDWVRYEKLLKCYLHQPSSISTSEDLEAAMELLTSKTVLAYNRSCPLSRRKRKPKPPWWNEAVGKRRREVKEFFALAKIADCVECWREYKALLSLYKKEIRRAKRSSWQSFCGNIDKTSEASRLRKILAKSPTIPTLICKDTGEWTHDCRETLEVLMDTHFPGCSDVPNELAMHNIRSDENFASLVSTTRLDWALKSFDPFKSPGQDGIFPTLLQKGSSVLIPRLKDIFLNCLRLNYVPRSWRLAKVVFIPKPGKSSHLYPKDYRPISLTSFVLKTFERLLDSYIKERTEPNLLSPNQHAYTKGKSTETALHRVVLQIEKALHYGEYAMGVFLDISGAFNNVSTEALMEGLESTGVEPAIRHWIGSLLNCRLVMAEWGSSTISKKANRGTPQGGVLSPLLWNLVMNQILIKLGDSGPKLTAYADDLAVIISGRCPQTMSEILTRTLREIYNWTKLVGLEVNPDKTDLVLFTRKYKIPNWSPPILGKVQLTLKTSTKYLGVIVDSKLSWRFNVEERVKKASSALYACRKMLGKTWGLSPRLTHWIYMAVVKPIMLYGSLVWWTACDKTTYVKRLGSVQRIAGICVTGAMSTTPTAAIERLLDWHPIKLVVRNSAKRSALRLRMTGQFSQRLFGHCNIEDINERSDYVIPQVNFGKRPDFVIEQNGWQKGLESDRHAYNFFTDGSKMTEGVGAAVFCPQFDLRKSFRLPNHCSIFQAEIYAVTKATELALEFTPLNTRTNIFIDSQAAIKAIKAVMTNSECVQHCRSKMDELCENRQVTIYWVPGHKGIEGNERVDELAKAGTRLPRMSTSNIYPSLSVLKTELNDKLTLEAQSIWEASTSHRIAKIMLRTCNTKTTNFILSLPRKECKILVGVLTGHCLTPYHAAKMGLVQTDACNLCEEERGTLEHLLCHCPALSRTRYNCLGSVYFSSLKDIADKSLNCLLKLAKTCIRNYV